MKKEINKDLSSQKMGKKMNGMKVRFLRIYIIKQ